MSHMPPSYVYEEERESARDCVRESEVVRMRKTKRESEIRCVCEKEYGVCVRKNEKEYFDEGKSRYRARSCVCERQKERARDGVCVCVCV